jgi:hypothetical protein
LDCHRQTRFLDFKEQQREESPQSGEMFIGLLL